jgi:hypothetical protein
MTLDLFSGQQNLCYDRQQMAASAITSQGPDGPHHEKDIMVTPEYARAYIDELTQFAQPNTTDARRMSLGRLLRRLSR